MDTSQTNGEVEEDKASVITTNTTTITPVTDGDEEDADDDDHPNDNDDDKDDLNQDHQELQLQHRSVLEKIGGFDLLFRRPLIGHQKNLLVVSGRTVRNYSYETGAFLNEFTFGQTRPIVAIQAAADGSPSQSPDHLTVVSENGRILVWNTATDSKVDECFLRLGVGSRVTTFHQAGDHHYYTVLRSVNRKKVSQIFARHRASGAVLALNSDDQVNSANTDKSVAFGPGGRHCATLHADKLYVYSIPPRAGGGGGPPRTVHSMSSRAKRFTVVAYHPTDETVRAASRILHWHSQPVADLAFSPGGTFLYSVGAEKTLVKWNLVGKFAGERSFLPRLGAAIVSVVVAGGEESGKQQAADNIIVASLADQTLAGLTVGFNEEGRLSAPTLAYCERLRALVLNGRVGHVQLYQPGTQRQLRQVDVTEQNVTSGINTQRLRDRLKGKEAGKEQLTKIYPLQVTAIAVSQSAGEGGHGDWMATVEHRDDGETMPEVRLKFWEMEQQQQQQGTTRGKFHLNTTVHLPHTDRVNSIAFSKTAAASSSARNDEQHGRQTLHLVTTSADRSFKIWDLNGRSADDGGTDHHSGGERKKKKPRQSCWWSCSRTGSLNAFAVPRMAAFSADGSLLAVLFDAATLTLWELEAPDVLRYIPRLDLFEPSTDEVMLSTTENSTHEQLLPPPQAPPHHQQQQQQEPLLFLDFAGDAHAHLLITGTASSVTVRNVLKKAQVKAALAARRWTLMAYSGGEDNVLAAVSAASISLLSVATGQLLLRHSFARAFGGVGVAPFRGGSILAAVFTPETGAPSPVTAAVNDPNSLPLRSSTFYCINEKHELFQLAALDGARVLREVKGLKRISEQERRTLYMQAVLRSTSQLNQNQKDDNNELKGRAGSEVNRERERKAIVDKFFYSVPSHVLPPVALYEKAYLASCMGLLKLTKDEKEVANS
ncbi:WD repeat-containing protein 75 [Tyrophagus putrescentiae]|nr:WD repeat-containing protein 75 [Tyrophagus putrescentiae]